MKVREHRGSLDDSMSTCFEVQTKQELVEAISTRLFRAIKAEDVAIESYTYDARIQWDTYLITVKGQVFGFSNGMIA
jgi:hypothetical protein